MPCYVMVAGGSRMPVITTGTAVTVTRRPTVVPCTGVKCNSRSQKKFAVQSEESALLRNTGPSRRSHCATERIVTRS